MDRLVELLSACTTSVASTTARCGARSASYTGVCDDDEDAAAATVPINGANNNVDSSTFCGSLSNAFLDEPPYEEKKNVVTPPSTKLKKDHHDNVDGKNNDNSTFCGSLRNVFLDEPPQQDEKSNAITPRVATREKDRQDNDNDEEVMSDVWKDLTLYEDYKPPIPRVIETNIPSPTTSVAAAAASPKHKKNLRRNKSKNKSMNNTDNVKGNNNHTSPTKTNYKDDAYQQQQQRQHQQHVDEDESLMGLDLLSGEEVQKDFELPRSQAVLNTTTTSSSSDLDRQDIVWPGVKAPPVAAAATDGIRGEATEAKPHVRYSSTHSWTYSLTTCDAGGSSRSTGLGGGGGGDDEASPCSSSWSDNDFVDINEHGTTNSIDALFLGASSSSNGRDGGLLATLAAVGGAGELDDHDGSSYSNRDKSSSLLLRSVGVAGTNTSSVQPPSKITAKTISPRATKRGTSSTTSASPFLFHGHHNQPQPLLLTASSPSQSSQSQQQQQQQLKPQHVRTMNSHNSGTLTTRSTSMSDSATLNCSSTLATHDDDTAEDNIVIDTTDVPSNRLYHHMEHDDETQQESLLVEEDIGEEVETASI